MDNKFSYIKERCLKLAEIKGFSRESFCEKIGMTYGNFKGSAKKTPLNSTAIANILTLIPDLNLKWLISGEGEMLQSEVDKRTTIYQRDPRDAELIELQRYRIIDLEGKLQEITDLKYVQSAARSSPASGKPQN